MCLSSLLNTSGTLYPSAIGGTPVATASLKSSIFDEGFNNPSSIKFDLIVLVLTGGRSSTVISETLTGFSKAS